MTKLRTIEDFLSQKRLAIVGVSRDPQDFTRKVFNEFQKRGYEVFPVNPKTSEIDGAKCYPRLQEIVPTVDGALLMTVPGVTDKIVRDCKEAGIPRVWMHRGEGIGAVSESAIFYCQEQAIEVIAGFCPFMFLPNTGFFHRLHGFVKKVGGNYPK